MNLHSIKQALSLFEAEAFMGFNLCSCGSRRWRCDVFAPYLREEEWLAEVRFGCTSCDSQEAFTFTVGLFYPRYGAGRPSTFSCCDVRSELLDPIQWAYVADQRARQLPADFRWLSHPSTRAAACRSAMWARAALMEALKFYEADELAPETIASSESRRLLERHPDHYTKSRLLKDLELLCDVIDRLDSDQPQGLATARFRG